MNAELGLYLSGEIRIATYIFFTRTGQRPLCLGRITSKLWLAISEDWFRGAESLGPVSLTAVASRSAKTITWHARTLTTDCKRWLVSSSAKEADGDILPVCWWRYIISSVWGMTGRNGLNDYAEIELLVTLPVAWIFVVFGTDAGVLLWPYYEVQMWSWEKRSYIFFGQWLRGHVIRSFEGSDTSFDNKVWIA